MKFDLLVSTQVSPGYLMVNPKALVRLEQGLVDSACRAVLLKDLCGPCTHLCWDQVTSSSAFIAASSPCSLLPYLWLWAQRPACGELHQSQEVGEGRAQKKLEPAAAVYTWLAAVQRWCSLPRAGSWVRIATVKRGAGRSSNSGMSSSPYYLALVWVQGKSLTADAPPKPPCSRWTRARLFLT